jgi:hypothetical protein
MRRLNYSILNSKYTKIAKGNVRLTQSSLFLTKPINNTVTTYNFDVLETQTQTLQNDEIRLNLNDEFNITSIGLYLVGKFVKEDGTTLGENTKLFTYAPYNLSTPNAVRVQNFYAGTFKIAINNIVYMEKWDTARHEHVTRTQNGDFLTPNSATISSQSLSKDAMFDLANIITLSGAKKNDLTITLPSAIANGSFSFTDNSGAVNQIVIDRVGCRLFGFLAQNAASFQR